MTNLLLGISLGFAAGISPGPMMALLITRSVEKGFRSGARVALAPLFSDLPIVALAVLVVPTLHEKLLLGLSIAGGLLLVFLGVQAFRQARRASLDPKPGSGARDLTQAVLVNLLNPHPWLFWFSVGGPLLVRAWRVAPEGGISFLVSFYLLLVGSKITVAWLIAKGRDYLRLAWYRSILQSCGIMLVLVGLLLLFHRS